MAYLDTSSTSAGLGNQLSDLRRRLAKRGQEWILVIQYARMMSVLSNMPDYLLNEIGISRSEIPSHARRLVYGPE